MSESTAFEINPVVSLSVPQEDSKSHRSTTGAARRGSATAEEDDGEDDDEDGSGDLSDKVADVIALHAPASPAFARMARLLKQQVCHLRTCAIQQDHDIQQK